MYFYYSYVFILFMTVSQLQSAAGQMLTVCHWSNTLVLYM